MIEPLHGSGIVLKSEAPGKYRQACPSCDKGRHDTALEVTITGQRWAFWRCFRCAWEGKAPLDAAEPQHSATARQERREPRIEVVDPPPFHHVLSPQGHALWEACQLIAVDTPAATYFHGRGCALPQNDVRWHAALRHPSGHVGPGIVALITDAVTGEPLSLHRTWIKPDGSGKAELDKPRLLLKAHRKHGGVVRLVPDDEVTTGLCIGEGMETCLSAMWGFSPVWSVIDAGNMAAFPVLDGIESLTVVVDHDKAGLAAFNAVAANWIAAGREVRQWLPPGHKQDLNDWVGAAA